MRPGNLRLPLKEGEIQARGPQLRARISQPLIDLLESEASLLYSPGVRRGVRACIARQLETPDSERNLPP